MMTAKEIVEHFSGRNLAAEHAGYLSFHCRRYEFLLRTIEPVIAELRQRAPGRTIRILDVGPYFQTELIRRQPDALRAATRRRAFSV